MILITSTGEFILYFIVIFFLVSIVVGLFFGCPTFAAGIHFQWIKILKESSLVHVLWEN